MGTEPQVTYLELSDGREHKFYEVTVAGADVTMRHGRIGTDGQSKTTTVATPEAAAQDAAKKVTEKKTKGYVDAVAGQRARKAVEKPRIRLHRALEPYRERIEATLKPVVFLTLHEGVPGPLNGKIGGVPYRVKGEPWPAAPDGTPMTFLAQLNFAELPESPRRASCSSSSARTTCTAVISCGPIRRNRQSSTSGGGQTLRRICPAWTSRRQTRPGSIRRCLRAAPLGSRVSWPSIRCPVGIGCSN